MMPSRDPPLPQLSAEAGNGAIFGTLGCVLVLTIIFGLVKEKMQDKTTVAFEHDAYLSARNTQGVVSMTLSYFVSGMGAWVIFAAPQAAVIGGSFALIGYALSTTFPLLLFGVIAPMMRKNVPHGYTMNEYILARLGPINAVYFSTTALFYMFLYLCAELSSAGTLASALTNIPLMDSPFWENDNVFTAMPLSPILGVSLITLAYTVVGGLPVSILTDRIQAVGIFLLTLIITIATYAYAGGWDGDRFSEAAGHGVHPIYVPTDYGNSIAIAISLILGVTCANMFHAGYWQRVWAAESNSTVKTATYLASVGSMIVMLLVGITGWVAYGHYGANIIIPDVFDITFFSSMWLVNDFMGSGWAVITVIFGIAMIASTVDTLQSGMTALLWPAANKLFPNLDNKVKLGMIIVVMALINAPAIIIALSGQSILQLFLLADLVAACAVAPLFLGFWERTHPIATIVGSLAGVATLLIVYAIGETWGEGYDTIVNVQGGIFKRSAAYAFCLVPFFSAVVTVAVSLAIPGYKFEGYPDAGSKTKETKDVQMNQMAASAPDNIATAASSC